MTATPVLQPARNRAPQNLKQRLPWRMQLALSPSFYVERLTDAVFRRVLSTRPLAAGDGNVEVMSLLDRRNLNNYLLAIKSLLLNSPVPLAVTVLSDGTLRAEDRLVLQKHVHGIRVLERSDVTLPAAAASEINRWCDEYPYLAKLMYLPFASRKPLLLIMDSDVIFRRSLPANFFSLRDDVAAKFNCDHDHRVYDPKFHYLEAYAADRGIKLIHNLNCGLMLWRAAHLRPLDSLGFLRQLAETEGHLHAVSEQDAWSLLASQSIAEALPDEYLVLSNWAVNDVEHRRRAITVHYVSGERYRRLDYLRDGRQMIRLLRQTRSSGNSPATRQARELDCQNT